MLNTKKITALQIQSAEDTIKEIIRKRVVSFNLGRIRNEYKKLREQLNITILSEDQKNKIKNELIDDKISQEFKDNEYKILKTEFENYKHIRNNINNINDIGFDSVEIEKANLIQPDMLGNLIKASCENNNTALKLVSNLRNDVYKVRDKKTNNSNDLIDLFKKINQMYDVDTTVDDIEIVMKYGYENNVDLLYKNSTLIGEQNYSVFNHINNNKIITSNVSNNFLAYIFSDKITNNKISVFPNTYSTDNNLQKVYRLRTIGELLFMISNKKLKYQTKTERSQLYTNNDASRPKETEYKNWSGLQVYDLDLKDWINDEDGSLETLKSLIHKQMVNYHWYLWICKSSSGNGLHIYTKVAPPHHQNTNPLDNEESSRYWFNINYITKLNMVYKVLVNIDDDNNLFKNKSFINKYVDNVVGRITAGIRLSYDENPYVNNNFLDLNPTWLLGKLGNDLRRLDILNDLHESANEKSFEEEQTKTNKFVARKLKRINDMYHDIVNPNTTERDSTKITNLMEHIKITNDITITKTLNSDEINYFSRYNVCNTLASVVGVSGLSVAHDILRSSELGNTEEINAFYSCALSNAKAPSKLGLQILKKVGFIKTVSEELTTEIQEGFKYDIKREIEKVLINEKPSIDYNLKSHEYISDYSSDLERVITGERVNIIFSPPGTGKTHYIKQLAASGKRVLLVLPYISVIKNKIENDPDILEFFDVFYGSVNIKDIEYGRNAVTTFDKFSRINYDKISRMFDYIFIDESHLLFTSSYRIDATSNAIKKIKELFYISSNDDMSAKIVLMTGTETGESHFFKDVSQIIRITKNQLERKMKFMLCDDTLDAITRMAQQACDLINSGYKLLIPTNKGEIYTEKFIGMLTYLTQRELKYGYYKRSNDEQEICKLINEDNSVGDYDVVFCSNYLSVGVDINDSDGLFASLYMGNFAGYEIEQFNARIRKTTIDSFFFIITEKENGDIYNNLIIEPSLVLKITDNDKLFFVDDKSIAKAKTEFIADYDPVLKKITTPGFSLLNGKIQFNLEEYELTSFELKYIECMEHPVKVARELAKYGYNVDISDDFNGLPNELKQILKQTGIASAKEEKLRKHDLIIQTFYDLINSNVYINKYGLEYNNVIQWIQKNPDKIIENRQAEKHVEVVFNAFASPQEVIVKSKESLDKIIGYAKYLISQYSVGKCIEIIDKYIESGVLRLKNFRRSINLLKLIDSSDNNELSEPLTKTIEKIYSFVDTFETNKDHIISYNTYHATLDTWTNEYIDYLGIGINTKYGYDKIRNSILELLLDISKKSQSKKGIKFTYNKLPNQDSSNILNKKSIDSLINNIFKISEIKTINKSRNKHITLTDQSF